MADTKSTALDFAGEVRDELKKVTWPDVPQLKNSTFVIVVFVIVMALVIFGIDAVVALGLNVLHSLFGG